MTVAGDVRAFLAAARKELQIIRRYPLNYVGGLFWGALLPAVYVLMGQAYSVLYCVTKGGIAQLTRATAVFTAAAA